MKLDLEQIVIQGLELEAIEKIKSAERKALTRKNGLKQEDAQYVDGTTGQTRDIVAKKLGYSGKHWERMKYIYQHKEQYNPQEYEDWKHQIISTSKLYTKLKRQFDFSGELDKIINILSDMQEDTFGYLTGLGKYNRLNFVEEDLFDIILYQYPEELKQDVSRAFENITKISFDFIERKHEELSNLIDYVEEVKRKASRNCNK